jgi:hypothetical protein
LPTVSVSILAMASRMCRRRSATGAWHQNTSTRSSLIVSQNRGCRSSRNHDIGVAAEQVAELDPRRSEIEQREVMRRRRADQHVDVAPAPGITARQGAEQPEPGDAEGAQIGLVLAKRPHHALALDERRIGSLHMGGHGEAYGATAEPYRLPQSLA